MKARHRRRTSTESRTCCFTIVTVRKNVHLQRLVGGQRIRRRHNCKTERGLQPCMSPLTKTTAAWEWHKRWKLSNSLPPTRKLLESGRGHRSAWNRESRFWRRLESLNSCQSSSTRWRRILIQRVLKQGSLRSSQEGLLGDFLTFSMCSGRMPTIRKITPTLPPLSSWKNKICKNRKKLLHILNS